jgi:hypothetical protein
MKTANEEVTKAVYRLRDQGVKAENAGILHGVLRVMRVSSSLIRRRLVSHLTPQASDAARALPGRPSRVYIDIP